MSVDIVQVGLKHDLPVNDIWKAADILSRRLGKKYQRQIYFKDYFARKLSFNKDEFVSLIYDDFEDL